jgi:hypothetical protein
MASDFKQIVDYLLTYYAPLIGHDYSEELDREAIKEAEKERKVDYSENRTAAKVKVEKVKVEKAPKLKRQYQVISPSGELLTFQQSETILPGEQFVPKSFL